ncbi:MAG: DNA recombination protein RmuC [Dehalococcoidia bacterium]|nr:DNA recombination protein RmuC [Dehalococcoidia bacterium]
MNELMIYGLIFLGGLVIGITATIIISRVYKPYYKQDILTIGGEIQKNMAAFTDTSMQASVQHLVEMSEQVLSKHTQLGEQNLDTKKQLIDQSIKEVRDNLKTVESLVSEMEKNRERTMGQLSEQLKIASEQASRLQETTGQLQQALGNSKIRGQWGERMADDILRSIGFVEGTNYRKQAVSETTGNRPDYTFLMPNNLQLNMDVKFPLDNYMKYVGADTEVERDGYKNDFLKDTRQRIKEVTTREYINPEQNTVDYVLVLIPNEQVYRFINENDPTLLDYALQSKVVLCSPVTLYAVLALINQAVRNFKTEQAIDEIIQQVSFFLIQWQKYVESMDKMGKKISETQKEFDNLITTRRNKLERPLKKIDDIRKERNIEELEPVENDVPLIEAEESHTTENI